MVMGAPTVDLEEARFSDQEKSILVRELGRSAAYFEFGMGGSTLLAVRAGVPRMVSVDSDAEWVKRVQRHPEIAPRCADGSMSAIHADIGPVRDWGNPVDRNSLPMWNAYLAMGWAEWARRNALPDLVLVDGRFWIACCISVALVSLQLKDTDALKLMLHDFNEERPQYRLVLEFFDDIELVDSLLLMKPRANICAALAVSRLMQTQFDFG